MLSRFLAFLTDVKIFVTISVRSEKKKNSILSEIYLSQKDVNFKSILRYETPVPNTILNSSALINAESCHPLLTVRCDSSSAKHCPSPFPIEHYFPRYTLDL